MTEQKPPYKILFEQSLSVLNVGLESFAETLEQTGHAVTHLDWRPPGGGRREVAEALAVLADNPTVEAANATAFERYLAAQPILIGVGKSALGTLPGMQDKMLLHAGPPVEWEAMSGPMRGAMIGAMLYEGWADDVEAAIELGASGEITFDPCHHHQAVGPMAGVVAPSMPVWIVENPEHGNRSYATLNEGLGKVLRFGAYGEGVIAHLKWMEKTLYAAIDAAFEQLGSIELKPLMAQALHMGDEIHNRNVAATSLTFKKLAPALLRSSIDSTEAAKVLEFIAGNDHFFLNISMAACKAMLDAAHNVEGSTMVTAMARNGTEFGLRVSGTGDQWFTAPAPIIPDALYFSGYSHEDASPDIGDSAITETAGIGGFAMATAPAIAQFVGGTSADALGYTQQMMHITLGRNNAFTLPALEFEGTPAAIDVRKVVDSNIHPLINTGIAHKEPGVGQIGAGITRAPMACFEDAVVAIAARLDG